MQVQKSLQQKQQTPDHLMFEQLGLIGCGLMGGSFALALKRAGLVKRVVGYSKSPSTTELARQMGVIDVAAPSALLAVSGADIVLLAVPVAATEATFKAIRQLVGPNTLIMDVGSTKRDVVDAARRVLRDNLGAFVPCHPITGKEVSGIEHADADLYTGKQVILTPIERTFTAQLKKASDVWTALGCHVVQMSPHAHDAAYAAVSHLPHLIAFALINGISGQEHGKDYLSLAGPGFRDFTRIAASDPTMWRDIFMANREELLAQSKLFQQTLQSLEHLISSGSTEVLEVMIEQASETRANWRISSPKSQK
jgi:prephenate dehydrogenase